MHIKVADAEFASEMLLCFPGFMLTALVLAEVVEGRRGGRGGLQTQKADQGSKAKGTDDRSGVVCLHEFLLSLKQLPHPPETSEVCMS